MQRWGITLVEDDHIISVEPMSQADAVALINKKLKKLERPGKLATSGNVECADVLASALECMPLAIVQATSYILQRAPRCSVRQYLEKFEQSDKKRVSLLDFAGGPRSIAPVVHSSCIGKPSGFVPDYKRLKAEPNKWSSLVYIEQIRAI